MGGANDESGGAKGRALRREDRGAVGAEDRGAEEGEVWGLGIFYLGMLHFGCNLMHFQT